MDIIKWVTEWATDPWGQNVPMHIAWFLIWVAGIAGLLFLVGLFAIIEARAKSRHTKPKCAFVYCIHFVDHTPSAGSA